MLNFFAKFLRYCTSQGDQSNFQPEHHVQSTSIPQRIANETRRRVPRCKSLTASLHANSATIGRSILWFPSESKIAKLSIWRKDNISMRTCPRCTTENADTEKFCRQCASPLQQSSGKTCPSGRHTMDPAWTECAYCKQENVGPLPARVPAVRQATVIETPTMPRSGSERPIPYKEDPPFPPRPPRPASPAASFPANANPGMPQPVTPPVDRSRSHTEFRPAFNPVSNPVSDAQRAAPATSAVSSGRKIVGLLITYSWVPEGQIFPIREGRNYIGRDNDCEVCVPDDQTMSGRNSHITFRQNFVVGDLVSMTGTDVDEVPIEEQFRSLPNYATIRAGSTHFTFISIKPPTSTAPAGNLPASGHI
jgi:Zn ribbon nucleic-acid-binding protein